MPIRVCGNLLVLLCHPFRQSSNNSKTHNRYFLQKFRISQLPQFRGQPAALAALTTYLGVRDSLVLVCISVSDRLLVNQLGNLARQPR